ncbi:hypothetical protein GALMADRAFT_245744 [Galerina marginata CBS 339.88]|uniref:Cytochrome P450 n=1 Tax=Galerina marginata (strain CBS 339.88) TaxID=685588 RepID=A0A067T385_GALM3|nr:hypothetical protein GALMADRAFT_245744 [Galerina marginata CBS 339.88]
MFSENNILQPGSLAFILSVLLLYYGCLWYFPGLRLRAKGIRLPPGPKPRFFTGNLHQVPKIAPWLTFASWSKLYGPIIYFRVMNKETIVLNSGKVALDLLESRSAIYSDRPVSWMEGELAGRKRSVFRTSLLDPRFKMFRRLLQNGLNARASESYRPIQTTETQTLLQGLANSPEDFSAHIRRNAVAVILKVAYGYQVESIDDPLVLQLEQGLKMTGTLSVPGKFLVEFIPLLRFVPSWIPGAGFKRYALAIGKKRAQIESVPFEWATKQIATGNFIESFTSKHLLEEGKVLDQAAVDDLRWCAAALYAGGGDTTVSALKSFILLMALHPEIQKRAQDDIDSISPNRLPVLDDFKSLPFIRSIVKETLRWGPVSPMGLPHRVIEADIYKNYFIPKGATVLANIWAITHDVEIYPDPETFDPSRHMGSAPQPDPFKFVFGYGRRICPGAHLAEMSLFLNMASILAVFNISKPVDSNGLEKEPEIAWTSGTTRHLKAFECQIKPRSKEHLSLLG